MGCLQDDDNSLSQLQPVPSPFPRFPSSNPRIHCLSTRHWQGVAGSPRRSSQPLSADLLGPPKTVAAGRASVSLHDVQLHLRPSHTEVQRTVTPAGRFKPEGVPRKRQAPGVSLDEATVIPLMVRPHDRSTRPCEWLNGRQQHLTSLARARAERGTLASLQGLAAPPAIPGVCASATQRHG